MDRESVCVHAARYNVNAPHHIADGIQRRLTDDDIPFIISDFIIFDALTLYWTLKWCA